MSEAVQALGLEPGGQALLTRLNSYELGGLMNAMANTPGETRRDCNAWMEAAGAHALRPLVHSVGVEPEILPGMLWELWNGQFFWTSVNGKAWDAVPIKS